jgi:uncharacterized protein with HEPN domain
VSPRTPAQRLNDIRDAIEAIACHQREATQVGLDRSSKIETEIPWRAVKGMRLWLDHEYHRVGGDVVRRTVDDRLGPLALAVDRQLSKG